MQDSVTNRSSLPANYVSINDLREQWLKKQRPKDEAVVEEKKEKEKEKEKWLKKERLEYEAEDEDEEELPRKYVTINDLREKWLKKQQKKEKDDEMRKENFGGNDELGFGVNPNLVEDDGDGNRGLMVDDSTLEKAEIIRQKNKKRVVTRRIRRINERAQKRALKTGIVEKEGEKWGVMGENEAGMNGRNDGWVIKKRRDTRTGPMRWKRWHENKRIQQINKEAQKRALQTGVVEEGEKRGVVGENEAEMNQIGVSVMHIAVTQETEKFRKKKRFPGRWNVVQKEKGAHEEEEEDKEKPFPVTGTRNTVQQEKRGHEENEKEKLSRQIDEKMKEVSILEKRYQEVEQEMKEKMNELSLLGKRFHDIEKMEETQATETDHNVSNNAEHGTYGRAMGYWRMEVSGRGRHGLGRGRGRGGGRSGNGGVWVKKDEGLHNTNY